MLILVLLDALDRLADHNQVVELGERGVLGARAGHIDDALLEADDLAGGDDRHAAQDVGFAGADSVDLGDDAGELTAGAFDLHAGLDDVLDRRDPHALARTGDVKLRGFDTGLDVVVLVHEGSHCLGVDEQGSVFYLAFL